MKGLAIVAAGGFSRTRDVSVHDELCRFPSRGGQPVMPSTALHNLSDRKVTVDLGPQPGAEGDPFEMFSDRAYDAAGPELKGVELAASGYRWIRLRESPGR